MYRSLITSHFPYTFFNVEKDLFNLQFLFALGAKVP